MRVLKNNVIEKDLMFYERGEKGWKKLHAFDYLGKEMSDSLEKEYQGLTKMVPEKPKRAKKKEVKIDEAE
jgi:hypothetical protein